MADPKENIRGILAMCLSMAAFVVNDAMVKQASSELPLGQILFIRGAVATGLLALVCWWRGSFQAWRLLADRLVAMRLIGELCGTLCFLTGLLALPFADATAIFQITPLAVTAGAALFLGARVGWRRWTAIAIGFVGVMMIIRPGFKGLEPGALFILGSVCFVLLRDLATARIPRHLSTELLSVATAATMMFCGLLMSPLNGTLSKFDSWQPVPAATLAGLTLAGSMIVLGYAFLTVAMRSGETAAVSPFRYTLLVWSFLVGMIAFGERPDAWVFAGSAVVVATGIYSFHRERIVALAARGAAA